MQISTRNADYIIDTVELRSEMHLLNDPFTDPKIVKVSNAFSSFYSFVNIVIKH